MIRKASVSDIKHIQRLINFYAKKDLMLQRSLTELYENIRDFFVYEQKGKILGCGALHVCWEDLAEVKSLAVVQDYKDKGIGSRLVRECLKEAKRLKIKKVFCLTYCPKFFKKFGFRGISKKLLPHKIWSECIKCAKYPACDEAALMVRI